MCLVVILVSHTQPPFFVCYEPLGFSHPSKGISAAIATSGNLTLKTYINPSRYQRCSSFYAQRRSGLGLCDCLLVDKGLGSCPHRILGISLDWYFPPLCNPTSIRLQSSLSSLLGPISLLVTTSTPPNSLEYSTLLSSISKLRDSHNVNKALSVHVLQLEDYAQENPNPNAYLNLARLFSRTKKVAIFPGNLSHLPPKALYKTLLTSTLNKPIVLTSRTNPNYPFSALSPLILNRDDPLWCTERFFISVSRELDWGECVWQVWLERFGDVDVKMTSEWVNTFGMERVGMYSSIGVSEYFVGVESNIDVYAWK